MKSYTTTRFREAFARLPAPIQRQARRAYLRFKRDPNHPSLRFRQVHPSRPIYSARINLEYRVVGVRDADSIVWFWVGSHAEYDRLLAKL